MRIDGRMEGGTDGLVLLPLEMHGLRWDEASVCDEASPLKLNL